MKKRYVYVVGEDYEVSLMFKNRKGFELVDDPTNADIVCFTGGEDVTPDLYGEEPHPRTFYNTHRDMYEMSIFKGLDPSILKVGICRGGQFLNVMSGGEMWQDVNNHGIGGLHLLTYFDEKGESNGVPVSSTHHQMMRPRGQYYLWGVASLTTMRGTGNDHRRASDYEKDGLDVEIVWYPKTNSLCFQPHPEYQRADGPCRDLFFSCIDRAIAFMNRNNKEAA